MDDFTTLSGLFTDLVKSKFEGSDNLKIDVKSRTEHHITLHRKPFQVRFVFHSGKLSDVQMHYSDPAAHLLQQQRDQPEET